MDKTIDKYFDLQKEIFDHVGYVEDWKVIPLDDRRNMYWNVDKDEKTSCKYASNKKDTQRFLPKWVYRGPEFTIVCCDPHTDGNHFLAIFRNDMEVKNG